MTAPAVIERDASKSPIPANALSRRQRMELLHSQMKQERQSFVSHWQDINRVLFPRRGRFFITDSNRGERRNQGIIDSSATFAARTLASGMQSGITSPARPWKRLTTPDPDLAEFASVKEWLHQVSQRMDALFLKSNFYVSMHRVYGDQGVYGTSAMLVDEDDEHGIRCSVFPIGSYNLATDDKGRVRGFSREFQMSVRQVVERYGYERSSAAVRSQWDAGSTEQWVPVVHVIARNEIADPRRLTAKYKPWASCTYEMNAREENGGFLRESGYDEFPVFAARWDVTAEDIYATDCPGMTALGDIKELQFAAKKGMQALEKVVNPPLVAPTSLERQVISQLAGGVTYDDNESSKGVRPLHEVRPDLGALENHKSQIRSRIDRAFFADLFLMLSYMDDGRGKQPVTATEIGERKEEKLIALGPVLEQMNGDVFNPLIARVFNVMLRNGEIPPAPPELRGVELKVEYLSIMHQAQKASGLGQLERFTAFATGLAKVNADAIDKIDTDELIDEYHDASGVPPRAVRPNDVVQKIRAERKKQQAEMAQAEQLKSAGKGVRDLSQADTSKPSALTDMLAGAGSGAG